MKILTLNAHSLPGAGSEERLLALKTLFLEEKPDVAAFQEISQEATAPALKEAALRATLFCPALLERSHGEAVPVKEGNAAPALAAALKEAGVPYSWTWMALKLGYSKYDEGISIFCREPITGTHAVRISRTDDYADWRRRGVLGVQVKALDNAWFYTAHMGWWDDVEEPFKAQWATFMGELAGKGRLDGPVWLMGDMNSPANERDKGYDEIVKSGWLDIYALGGGHGDGATVVEAIDGWREGKARRMRIDYIFCRRPCKVTSCRTVFDGQRYPVISDHFGVLAEIQEAGRG